MLLYVALRSLLSATFLLSAYTKAIDFSSFELRLIDTGFISWASAPYIAAALIFAEYLIGFYFLSFFFKSKAFNYLTAGFLLLFTFYLLALLASRGNNVNCGCMGESIAFTPWQAIIKNLLSAGMLTLIVLFEKSTLNFMTIKNWPFGFVVLFGVLSTAISLPPIGTSPKVLSQAKYFNRTLLQEAGFNPPVAYDFTSHSNYFIGFLSMHCSHCRIAAERIGLIQKSYPEMPIFLVLNGDSSEVIPYCEARGIQNIPYTMLGAAAFIELAGNSVPMLYLVKNDSIRYSLAPYHLNGKLIAKLLQ